MNEAIDVKAVADQTVKQWNEAGRMPEMAWDFRGLVEDGILKALASHPLERELSEAYTEMNKIRPALTAIFNRDVWEKVARWAKGTYGK